MKKSTFIATLFWLVLSPAMLFADNLEMVILLDISESMLPYYDDTVNFLIHDILDQHLQDEDKFHLLSFADFPEVEISKVIKSNVDIENVLARLLLLQPFGQNTDLVRALKFLYNFTSNLSAASQKRILILTDGIHDPPEGSPYPVADQLYRQIIAETANDIKEQGWDVGIIQFPEGTGEQGQQNATADLQSRTDQGISEDAATAETASNAEDAVRAVDSVISEDSDENVTVGADSGENLLSELSDSLEVDVVTFGGDDAETAHLVLEAPELIFPETLGKVGYRFSIPFIIQNVNKERVSVRIVGINWDGIDILRREVGKKVPASADRKINAAVSLPKTVEPGEQDLYISVAFSEDMRIFPRTGNVRIELKDRSVYLPVFLRILAYIGIGLGAAVALLLISLFLRKIMRSTVFAAGTSVAIKHGTFVERDRPVEMTVEGQNSHIGTRNVHVVKDGTSRSIGGGRSSYLVYLFPFPAHIATISCKGESYIFTPEKEEFCENKRIITDCLDQEITIVSKTGRKVNFRFRKYISELEKINMIMHLTDKPGTSKQ